MDAVRGEASGGMGGMSGFPFGEMGGGMGGMGGLGGGLFSQFFGGGDPCKYWDTVITGGIANHHQFVWGEGYFGMGGYP